MIPAQALLTVAAGHATLRCPALSAGDPVALLLDSELVATAPVGPDGVARLPLPPAAMAGQLEAIGPGGQPLAPKLSYARRVEWLGWSAHGPRIEGAFRAEGLTAPVLVEAFHEGRRMLRALARPSAGAHRFSAPVARLWAIGAPLTLRPCIGGLDLDYPLHFGPSDLGLAGYLDPTHAPILQGWALDLNEPTRPLRIELRIDGVPFAVIEPSLDRADLAHLAHGQVPFCGFTVPLPADLPPTRTVTLSAVLAETGIELAGSPYRLRGLPHRVVGSLDHVTGRVAHGWAYDAAALGETLVVEALCRGQVIGAGRADHPRADLAEAGVAGGACAFHIHLDRPLEWLLGHQVSVRAACDGTVLPAADPRPAPGAQGLRDALARAAQRPAPLQRRAARAMTHRTRASRLTFFLPSGADPGPTVATVLAQWSENWELLHLDPARPGPSSDPRIRALPAPPGPAAGWQAALAAAQGDWIAPLAPGTLLQPHAAYRLLAAGRAGADFAYGDEATTLPGPGGAPEIDEVHAFPAFSHDHLLSWPHLPPLFAVRTDLARRALAAAPPDASPLDITLRLIEHAATIAHCPGILATRSASSFPDPEADRAAIAAHLHRLRLPATVHPTPTPGALRLEWPDDCGEVLAIIPTKDRLDLLRPCLDSLLATAGDANLRILVVDHASTEPETLAYLAALPAPHASLRLDGPFDFARLNNAAARAAAAPYLLFLNNDVTAIGPGWLQRLRSLVARPGTAAAAPLLLYGDDLIQHAGVLLGFHGGADHLLRFRPAYTPHGTREPGPLGALVATREVSALTAACLLVRRDAFQAVGGFDERFPVAFNDTDLCLRLAQAGHRVVYDGRTILHHHEAATRGPGPASHAAGEDALLRALWPGPIANDPFYNPMLTLAHRDHELRDPTTCRRPSTPRLRPGPAALPPSSTRTQ